MDGEPDLTPDMPIAELGRQILADQLAIMEEYRRALYQDDNVTAVHETRKAIRRTYTAVRLFRPYFEPGLLDGYRRRLRKLMKRLAPCRDTAVFLSNLQTATIDSPISLDELEQYWQDQKTAADMNLSLFLERPKWSTFWGDYANFTSTPDIGVPTTEKNALSFQARYLIPFLLHQRVAAVRAYGDNITQQERLSVEQLHQLRIQCKELRYAFQFFEPFLGSEIEQVVVVLKLLQVNLGDLNDARVALEMLDRTPGRETAVAHYQKMQKAKIERLLDEFHPLWSELNAFTWRRNLALVLSIL